MTKTMSMLWRISTHTYIYIGEHTHVHVLRTVNARKMGKNMQQTMTFLSPTISTCLLKITHVFVVAVLGIYVCIDIFLYKNLQSYITNSSNRYHFHS